MSTITFKEWVEKPVNKEVDVDAAESVAKIAKKHNVSPDKIAAQLKKGISVEHEHTEKRSLATKIALDHLNEKPDYYTSLANMEKGECDN